LCVDALNSPDAPLSGSEMYRILAQIPQMKDVSEKREDPRNNGVSINNLCQESIFYTPVNCCLWYDFIRQSEEG
jgi:hypothetical protein